MAKEQSIFVALACLGLLTVGCTQEAEVEPEVVRPIKIHEIGSLDSAAYRDYPGSVQAFQESAHGLRGFRADY